MKISRYLWTRSSAGVGPALGRQWVADPAHLMWPRVLHLRIITDISVWETVDVHCDSPSIYPTDELLRLSVATIHVLLRQAPTRLPAAFGPMTGRSEAAVYSERGCVHSFAQRH